MNVVYLILFLIGIVFGAPALMWVYQCFTNPSHGEIERGLDEAQAYANRPSDEDRAVVADSFARRGDMSWDEDDQYELEWACWLYQEGAE